MKDVELVIKIPERIYNTIMSTQSYIFGFSSEKSLSARNTTCGTKAKRGENMERNCKTCKNYKKYEETGVKSCSKWDCEYEEKEVENDDN